MQLIFVVAKHYLAREWLGIMYLSAYLKKHGFHVEVCPDDIPLVRGKIEGGPPTVVGYSTPSILARHYLDFNRELKRSTQVKFWSVFGGPHPTYYPETLEVDGVDAICRGEGEEATLEFLTLLRDGRSPLECRNWHVKDENGRIHMNPLRPLLDDLDTLPFPDRTLFRVSAMTARGFMASRGCPFRCTYCFNHAFNKLYRLTKAVVRRRSVDNVVEELAQVKAGGGAFAFQAMDDIICYPPLAWIEEFADKYPGRVGLPVGGNVRANLVTEPVVQALKRAGFIGVAMGVESGSERVRRDILKRNMSNRSILGAGRLLREAGIMLTTYNLVGIPGGDMEADLETLRINMELRPLHAICFILGPYKGTEIFEIADSLGMIPPDYVKELEGATQNLYGWHPRLKYANEKDGLCVENMHKLFSIVVAFPFLYRIVPWMLNRRWTPFYGFVSTQIFRTSLLMQRLKLLAVLRKQGLARKALAAWLASKRRLKR